MANGNGSLPNPLAAPLMTLKQIGEQTNQMISSMGMNLARSTSQGLDALASGSLPGLPGATGKGLSLPSNLMPKNLTAALTNIQNVLLPPGLTKTVVTQPTTTVTPTPGGPAAPAAPAATGVTGRRRITELGGY